MKLRFLKKSSGEKVLQSYNPAKDEYEDIPMEEENALHQIRNAIANLEAKLFNAEGVRILMSKKFYDGLTTNTSHYINSVYGYKIFLVNDLSTDFKFVKEVEYAK